MIAKLHGAIDKLFVTEMESSQEALTSFMWIMGAFSFISIYRVSSDKGLILAPFLVWAFLVAGIGLAFVLQSKNLRLAWIALVLALIGAIAAETWGYPDSPARYYYPLAILVASITASRPGFFATSALTAGAHLIVLTVMGDVWRDSAWVSGPFTLIFLTTLTSWFATRYLHSGLSHAETFSSKTSEMLEEIRTQRAELTRTVKALEEAKRRLEKMNLELDQARSAAEEADRLKSEFLAHMSHELRTPLNAILNFTAFVSDGLMGDVNEGQVDALQKVTDSANHLLSLINDILDISKIEAGMMSLFIEEVDVNEALNASISIARGLLKNKPVHLITEVEGKLPHINGDRRRIRQMFLNLISNAVKFTPQGSITVTARHLPEANEIYIAVEDTGIGIATEDQQMVFAPFRQAVTDLQSVAGTGLGLPITRHFVEAHGGRIWLDSRPKEGSTFHIALPVNYLSHPQAVLSEAKVMQGA